MEAKRKKRIYFFRFLASQDTLRYNMFVETKILADHFIKCFKLCAICALCGKFYFSPQKLREKRRISFAV